MRIAVVGSGIAGLGAAWCLSQRHEVAVFEAAGWPGGHANTLDIEVEGRRMPVDTGFIVYNETNYPHLVRLFDHLGVETDATDMSFAVSLDRGRLEYEGSLRGLLAQPSNLLRPAYLAMLRDIVRFYRQAPALLDGPAECEPSLGEFLDAEGYSRAFAERHLLPMGAAIWSGTLDSMRDFPARSFVRFFVNHHLFDLTGRPPWRTVRGGSREYVRRLSAAIPGGIRLSTPIVGLRRAPEGVWLRARGEEEARFDQVVLATHGDQALAILGAEATAEERAVLGRFRYRANRTILHTDTRLMPRRRAVWASWNYMTDGAGAAGPDRDVCVSYWMNRLQNLPCEMPVVVTLNPTREPAPDKVLAEMSYDHPQFDHAALRARRDLPMIQGARRTWFCGSYCGDGFHEDGLEAGFAVAAALDAAAPWAGEVRDASPASGAVSVAPWALAAE